MEIWQPVYIGIGSNLADPVKNVTTAVQVLDRLQRTHLVQCSSLFKNPPLAGMDQPDYINAVAAILTLLSPQDLLDSLQRIENDHGRNRDAPKWASRTLDLDILVYADLKLNSDTLTIPHIHMAERKFVLGPLNEIAPTLQIPGLARVSALAAQIDLTGLEKINTGQDSS